MTLVKIIEKKHLYVVVTLEIKIAAGNYNIKFSNKQFEIDKFIPDFIENFEQSMNFSIRNLYFDKIFFNQFITNNFASYNKSIYRIEKEIKSLRKEVLESYIKFFGA